MWHKALRKARACGQFLPVSAIFSPQVSPEVSPARARALVDPHRRAGIFRAPMRTLVAALLGGDEGRGREHDAPRAERLLGRRHPAARAQWCLGRWATSVWHGDAD